MTEIKVSYKIGNKAYIKSTKEEVEIIGYEHIGFRGTRYIVLVGGKEDRHYYYDGELEIIQQHTVGFKVGE